MVSVQVRIASVSRVISQSRPISGLPGYCPSESQHLSDILEERSRLMRKFRDGSCRNGSKILFETNGQYVLYEINGFFGH